MILKEIFIKLFKIYVTNIDKMSESTLNINRYPGVKPFTKDDEGIFFGRKEDVRKLDSLIFIKQVVVLYGKSGYGKSSLLNAGIIPNLIKNGKWMHFSIRFNNFSDREEASNISPANTVKMRLSHKLTKKRYLLDKICLLEDSFWYWIKNNQQNSCKSQFILLFDQFEELFSYPKEQIDEFSEQLSQLLYTTIPVKFRKRLSILDEEGDLADDVHDFVYDKPEIKVVFSIRSDRLSLLNGLTDRHPMILQNFYELNALSRDQAYQAILEPSILPQEFRFKTSDFKFTTEATNLILNNISNPQDGKIETSTLQIVCRYIEDELVNIQHNKLITVEILGDINDIFQQYYENILNKLDHNNKRLAQHLVEDELIESSKRNLLSESYIQNKFGISVNLLNHLEQTSLLRKERDASGRILYEISHDSLIGAIEKVAHSRRELEENIRKKELEKQLESEKLRANELIKLNNLSRKRSKIAITLAVVCFLISILAVISQFNAVNAKMKAEEAEKLAKEMEEVSKNNENLAKQAKYKSEIASARLFKEKGDHYSSEYGNSKTALETAIFMYDSALYFIKDYQNVELYNDLKLNIKKCQERL